MTDRNKIKQLLTAFYNGNTTREEEAFLRKFFNDPTVSEEWQADRDLFYALYDSSDIRMPEGFSERLENRIDSHIKAVRTKTRRLWISMGSIAVAILLLAGLFFFKDNSTVKNDVITDTYTDPQEAAVVAEKILALVSSELNKGLSPLEKAKESIDKTNELLNKNLKR
ncbi:MAG: hypothetical protein LBL07_06055 [Tannerella sp.]|jgi:hypothetical protein|nr:hypothetical protein [Tannerella sp.]